MPRRRIGERKDGKGLDRVVNELIGGLDPAERTVAFVVIVARLLPDGPEQGQRFATDDPMASLQSAILLQRERDMQQAMAQHRRIEFQFGDPPGQKGCH